MDTGLVIAALNSDIRREILKLLCRGPLNVKETMKELESREIKTKYRETIYRALETLSKAKLVEKYYEKDRGLCYRLTFNQVIIEIKNESINIIKSI